MVQAAEPGQGMTENCRSCNGHGAVVHHQPPLPSSSSATPDVSTQTPASLLYTPLSFLMLLPLENTLGKPDQKQGSRVLLCLRASRARGFAFRSNTLH